MYKIKKPGLIKFLYGDTKKMAKKIGINHCHLSGILTGNRTTKYQTAYCIVKLYDPNKEVDDFFDRI